MPYDPFDPEIIEQAQRLLRVDEDGRLMDGTPCDVCGRRAAWLCEYRVDHDGNRCERAVCADHSRPHGLPPRWQCPKHDPPKEQIRMDFG